MNPCTADKTRITLKSQNGTQYNIKNVCYTPIASENKGFLEIFPENPEFNLNGTYSLFGDFLDLDGNPVTGELNTVWAAKLPDYTDKLYISRYYVKKGDKTSYFKDGTGDYTVVTEFINATGEEVGSINVTAVIVKSDGSAVTVDSQASGEMRFKSECVFANYTPHRGDTLFVTAFSRDGAVLGSGFSLTVD